MSATNRRRAPNDAQMETVLAAVAVGVVVVGVFTVWLAGTLAGSWQDHSSPGTPWGMWVRLATGKYTWPGTAGTVLAVVLLGLWTALALWVRRLVKRRGSVAVDRAQPYLAQPDDLTAITTAGAAATARRIGAPAQPPGVHIGRSLRGKRDFWGTWEDMHVDIWGPRTGKTASRAIPNIVAAPGACVVTSNKRDVVDATRGARERHGKVWVFDPQGQAGEPASWYWDPLSYVGGSLVRAVKLAGRFSSINRPDHARSDAYFEPAAEDLIANLLLAASVSGNPITQVRAWLNRPTDTTPERILRSHGHDTVAEAVAGVFTAPDRQRAGVFGAALQITSFLAAPTMTEWVTSGSTPGRPAFDYVRFIREANDTLYLLSEETNKMAAPLVLALTAAIAEEAENHGTASPNGRLPVPMLFVLDEAANVCPWKALPDKYSHFGSRGIVMMTILQSWAQGAAAWGENGMAKLWGAANVRVYGGGVADTSFLDALSKTTGTFEPETMSTSRKAMGLFADTINRQTRPESILDVGDFASMPRGRIFVQYSGVKPFLARTVPWWETEHADIVRESLARYDPGRYAAAGPSLHKAMS